MRNPIYLRLAVAFVFVFTSTVQGSSSQHHSQTMPQKTFCRFRNKEYSPGDVWYPSTSTTTVGANCVICTCLMSGRQNCTKQDCPTDCNLDRSTPLHPCCKVCEERDSDSAQSVSQGFSGGNVPFGGAASDHDSGEEEDDDGDIGTDISEFVSCLHQGKIYKDGESFTANMSGLPISVQDQCMQCICQSGMVLCQSTPCSDLKCSNSGISLASTSSTSNSGDTCCQRCIAWKTNNKNERLDAREEDLTGFGRSSDQNQRGFISNSGLASIAPESSITFRDVSSNNGNVPGNGKDRSKQVDDCISSGRFYLHGSTWHPVIGPFGMMECVICKCIRGQIDCGRLKCPAKKDMPCQKPAKVEGHCCPICTTTVSADGSKMCVSGKQDVTAYRSHGFGNNGTEFIIFGFVKQRRNAEPQVDQHEWTLRDGEIIQFATKYLSNIEFTDLKTRRMFVLLGATNDKNLEKFTRREKKLEKRCAARCSVRIASLERSLRIHKLTSRKQCLTHERIVST